jgi:2-keto-3-deoxy-L-rhamnonate aldolase RhmA
LKKAPGEGSVLYGIGFSTTISNFVEIICHAGPDFAFIDTEHTIIGLGELLL